MRDDNVDAASRRVPTDVDAAPRRIPPDNHPNEMIPPVPDFPPTPTYFDPLEPIANLAGNLPHWRQDVCIYFVTFRLADSIPAERLHRWLAERDDWLARNPPPHSPAQRREYHDRFTERLERWLDRGYGSCVLREARVKSVVENALRHFAGCRYALDEFVVMPNHVHVLVTPWPPHELSAILHSWKSFTAKAINRLCGGSGPLWQKESFDHIVRSPESLERFRQYIRNNPLPRES
ncbi:MAG: transposase [Thermoguttaceae bacterium]